MEYDDDDDDQNKPPPTLYEVQHDFLSNQIRLLSQVNFRPSPAWHAANDAADDGLSHDAIEYGLVRARNIARQHCRRVYTPQATRVVAERIENGHLDALEYDRYEDDGEGNVGGERGPSVDVDLTDDAVVAALASEWPIEKETTSLPMDAARYAALVEQLSDLSQRRQLLRARIERLRRVKASLGPFMPSEESPEDEGRKARNGIQENLITRGCELERELERMKMLLARVGGRVALLPTNKNHETVLTSADALASVSALGNPHLEAVLDGF